MKNEEMSRAGEKGFEKDGENEILTDGEREVNRKNE